MYAEFTITSKDIRVGGLTIQVSEHLAGGKLGVKMGNTVFISPAMWNLMIHSEGQELITLLSNIGLVILDDCSKDMLMDQLEIDPVVWRVPGS